MQARPGPGPPCHQHLPTLSPSLARWGPMALTSLWKMLCCSTWLSTSGRSVPKLWPLSLSWWQGRQHGRGGPAALTAALLASALCPGEADALPHRTAVGGPGPRGDAGEATGTRATGDSWLSVRHVSHSSRRGPHRSQFLFRRWGNPGWARGGHLPRVAPPTAKELRPHPRGVAAAATSLAQGDRPPRLPTVACQGPSKPGLGNGAHWAGQSPDLHHLCHAAQA